MSLHEYGFTGSPRKASSSSRKAGKRKGSDSFASQRNDRWIDVSPRKGKLPPNEIAREEELGSDVSSEEEGARPRLTKEAPIDLSSDSEEQRSESQAPVQHSRRLVKGRPKAALVELSSSDTEEPAHDKKQSTPPSSDLEEVHEPSEKAKGKRRARSPMTDTTEDEEVVPIAEPRKKQRSNQQSSQPLPDVASMSRKLVRGKPSSFTVLVPAPSSRKRQQPQSDQSESDSDLQVESSTRKTRSSTQKEDKRTRREARADPPTSRGAAFTLSLLSGEVDDGRGSSPGNERSPTPIVRPKKDRKQAKKRKIRGQEQMPSSTPEPVNEDLSDANDLGHMFMRNRLRQHELDESPHRYSQDVVPESEEDQESSESDIDDDISLDREVVVSDRLRPGKKKQDRFAELKAARAGKTKRDKPEAVTITSDDIEEEVQPPKQKRVVDLASSDEDSESEKAEQEEPAMEDFLVEDDPEDEATAAQLEAAREEMPMQFTITQSESLRNTLRDVLLAFATTCLDGEGTDFFSGPHSDWGNARQRSRNRIDDILPSLVKSSVWTAQFNKAVDAFPDLAYETIGAEPGCDVCGNANKTSTSLITLSGRCYDRDSYKKLPKQDDPTVRTFRAGRFCLDRVLAYHELKRALFLPKILYNAKSSQDWEFHAFRRIRKHITSASMPAHLGQAEQQAWAGYQLDLCDKRLFDTICHELEENLESARKRFGT